MHSQFVPVVSVLRMHCTPNVDGRATIFSIDGIGAFNLVSWGAMLEGLRTLGGRCTSIRDAILWFTQHICGKTKRG